MHLAQITNVTSPSNIFTVDNYYDLVGLLASRVLLFTIPIAGIYFFFRLILSGYSYMSSLGDPGKIQAAHQQIVNSAFGLLIVLGAFFIARIMEIILALNFL